MKEKDPNNKHNETVVMDSRPDSSNPGQQSVAVKTKRNGQFFDKDGNVVPQQSQEAHTHPKDFDPTNMNFFNLELFEGPYNGF